jgi:hypothetical protein
LFKKAAVLLILLCFSLGASATVFLVEPLEKSLESNGLADLGEIAPGETLKLVVQRKSGLGFEWDSLAVENLPPGWSAGSVLTDKALVALVSLPRDALESIQVVSFTARSGSQPFSQERFSVRLTVKRSLLGASMEKLVQRAVVGGKAEFRLLLNNSSIAEQRVVVSSTLPEYWFEPIEIGVEPMQTIDINLAVYPRNYGKREFSFTVSSKLNSFKQSFPAELNVFSSLRGVFSSALFGFPFFSISLLPHLIVNAFLALLS